MIEQQDSYKRGVDVSKWQDTIDWEKVAADGIQHTFIKMSEGGTYTDIKFLDNWRAAKNAGLKVNVYHYFRALSSTPKEQLTNIKRNLNLVDFDPRNNLLAIDVEKGTNEKASSDEMADHLQDLLISVKQDILLDVNPIIYCSPTYWDNALNWGKYDFSINPLWIANWNVEKPCLPQTWEKSGRTWSWWQYSSKGKVNGIGCFVDLNWVK